MRKTAVPVDKKTPVFSSFRKQKRESDLKIYNDFMELMTHPDSQVTAVENILMDRYDIFSRATIWAIRKRVEKRLKTQTV